MLNGSFSLTQTWFGLCTVETRLMKGCWSQMHEDLSHIHFCYCVTDYLRGLWTYTYKSFDSKSPNTLSGLSNQKITKSVSGSWEDNCLHRGLMNRMRIFVWFAIIILYLFCLCQHQFVKEKCNFFTRLYFLVTKNIRSCREKNLWNKFII